MAHDSFLTAVSQAPTTIGKSWVQLGELLVGPQNYDLPNGPEITIAGAADTIVCMSGGRYHIAFNAIFTNPTADGWFEGAIEPNGLSLTNWPSTIAQGHNGVWVPAAAAAWSGINMGHEVGYTTTVLSRGATVTVWARYATASGTDTIDVSAIVYVTHLT